MPLRRLPALVVPAASVLTLACGGGSSGQPTQAATSTAAKPAAQAQARGGSVAVALSEWAVKSTPAQAKAGQVTFTARNVGQAPHELVVLRTDKRADALGGSTEAPEPGKVGAASDIQPGASKPLSVALEPGHYVLLCNLPGHYSQGMRADFTVR